MRSGGALYALLLQTIARANSLSCWPSGTIYFVLQTSALATDTDRQISRSLKAPFPLHEARLNKPDTVIKLTTLAG